MTGELLMATKIVKKSTAKKNRVWIASKETVVSLIQKIQVTFEHKVTVSWFPSGQAAIYPTWTGKRSAFDAYMKQAGSFIDAEIALNEI